MTKVTARERVITAAQELMTGGGYGATTVDDIVQRADVAKGSFYHSFKSKEDLAIAALDDYAARGWAIISNGPYLKEQDPVQRALALVDYIEACSEELWSHGCLLGSIGSELANSYPRIVKRVSNLFDNFEQGIAAFFEPALVVAQVNTPSAKELSVHLLSVIEGSILAARSHSEPAYLQKGIRQFRLYLQLLLHSS